MQSFQPDYYNSSTHCSKSVKVRRAASLIGGATLAVVGLSRRSTAGLILVGTGGALAYFGSRPNYGSAEAIARGSVLVNCSPEEAYRLYRNFEELPIFMNHLESVSKIGERQYRWIARGPMDTQIRWDAEILDERENEFISWRSLLGSDVRVEGSISFRAAPGNRGTVVVAVTRYVPPAGALGRTVAKLLGKDPSFMMQQDLRRFKALIEAGEIPTTEGQPHGPRSAVIAALRMADPDRPIRGQARITEVFGAKRRIA